AGRAPSFVGPTSATFAPDGQQSFGFAADGFPLPTFSATNLPDGLNLTPQGVLSGLPAAGVYQLTVKAHNGIGQDATEVFTLTVNSATTKTGTSGNTATTT